MSLTEPIKDVRGMEAGAASRGAAGEPAEWLRFESLLVELSAAFVNVPAAEVDREIERWLQRIVEFLDIDRSTIAQLSEDGLLRLTHSWAREGFEPAPLTLREEEIPWVAGQLRRGEIVMFARWDDLPVEAGRDKQTLQRLGPRSNVTVPLMVGGSVIGALAFGSMRRERSWPVQLVRGLHLVAQVFTNALMRKRAREELERVHRFQDLVAQLSSSFVNVPAAQVDAEIKRWQERIVEFLGIDRTTVAGISEDGSGFHVTHSWAAPGFSPVPPDIPRKEIPWTLRTLLRGEVVKLARLDDLPPEAARDKESLRRIGQKSTLIIPLVVGGSVIGLVAFGTLRRERSWPPELVRRLHLVGQVFANALMRKRAQEQIDELLGFEQLLLQLSASFINLPVEAIGREIAQGLQQSAEFLRVDRATVYEFSDQHGICTAIHAYAAPGVQLAPAVVRREEFPWLFERLLLGEPFVMATPRDLAAKAQGERRYVQEHGIQSSIAVPLRAGGTVRGFVGWAATRAGREWPEALVQRLRLVGKIFSGALQRQRAEEQIGGLLRFERLLSEVSARCLNVPAAEMNQEVGHGLQRFGEFLEVDRATLSEFSADYGTFHISHWWGRQGVQAPPPVLSREHFPWVSERVLRGGLVCFVRPEDLPYEARLDREAYRRLGIISHILVPLGSGEFPVGAIAFSTVGAERSWPGGLVQRLRLVGEIFANALARNRAEEHAAQLRNQLARAARVTTMGELAAAIAHEVNQPLCAIVSNAQAARRILTAGAPDMEELRDALQDILQDGERGSAVLARIRRFLSRAPAERRPVDINDLIREVAAVMRTEMGRRRVVVKLQLADNLPPVLGDRVQLEQVILNLMANGADAMDDVKGKSRDLVIRSSANGTETVAIAVQDAGAGLDPGSAGRLFEPFFTTKPGGMGMGLAISKSIVEDHGGRLWAGPNAGPGATFQLSLPATKS